MTDAVPAMGLADGEYEMGPIKVRIEGAKATVSGTETIAGSVATMDLCVRHFKKSASEFLFCIPFSKAMNMVRL